MTVSFSCCGFRRVSFCHCPVCFSCHRDGTEGRREEWSYFANLSFFTQSFSSPLAYFQFVSLVTKRNPAEPTAASRLFSLLLSQIFPFSSVLKKNGRSYTTRLTHVRTRLYMACTYITQRNATPTSVYQPSYVMSPRYVVTALITLLIIVISTYKKKCCKFNVEKFKVKVRYAKVR